MSVIPLKSIIGEQKVPLCGIQRVEKKRQIIINITVVHLLKIQTRG
jgi:hypothetical protein